MANRRHFPSMEEVEEANRAQSARWHRFLPAGDTAEQQEIINRVAERLHKLGGMPPELERKTGF